MEELVKLFKKAKSKFYWFDFTVRGQRYRGSTGEIKAARATKVASMKLARALEYGELFPVKPTVLAELSDRFLSWLDEANARVFISTSTTKSVNREFNSMRTQVREP